MPRVTSWWLSCVQDPALFLAGCQLDLASLALEELGVDVCGDRHALGWTGARDMVGAEGLEEPVLPGGPVPAENFPSSVTHASVLYSLLPSF